MSSSGSPEEHGFEYKQKVNKDFDTRYWGMNKIQVDKLPVFKVSSDEVPTKRSLHKNTAKNSKYIVEKLAAQEEDRIKKEIKDIQALNLTANKWISPDPSSVTRQSVSRWERLQVNRAQQINDEIYSERMTEIKPRESQISSIFRHSANTHRRSSTKKKNLLKVEEEEEAEIERKQAEAAAAQPVKVFSYMNVSFYRATHIILSIIVKMVVNIQRIFKGFIARVRYRKFLDIVVFTQR